MKEDEVNKTFEVADKAAQHKVVPDVKEKDESNPHYTACFPGLVDLVARENDAVFLVREGDELMIKESVKHQNKNCLPPPKEQIQWMLGRVKEVQQHFKRWQQSPEEENKQLYDDLVSYHKNISELPKEAHYHLLALWDFHTYRQEYATYSPIICFFAAAERGKTRTAKGMIYVSYRGVRVTTMREAFIFRLGENTQSSLFIDLKDIWREARRNGCEDILLNRFEKGSTVPRVIWPERGAFRDTHYYEVYGPTVLATNRPLHNILDTRAIQITTQASIKQFENDVSEEAALQLRERLLAFRAYYLNSSFPEAPKPISGRLGDIVHPLLEIAMTVYPEKHTYLLQVVEEAQALRQQDMSETLEGQLLKILINLEDRVQGGIVSVADIVSSYNEGKIERYHISPQRAGQVFKALGFYSTDYRPRTSAGAAAVPWNGSLISRLAESHGIEMRSSETPEITENLDDSGVPDVSDDRNKSND